MPVQKAANESTRSNADDVTSMQHVFLHGTMTDHVHCKAFQAQLHSSFKCSTVQMLCACNIDICKQGCMVYLSWSLVSHTLC
jgi:hypothetical protein